MSLIKKSYKAITSKNISAFEKKHSIELPKDYKSFLLKTNGGLPDPSVFEIKAQKNQSVLNVFFGIDTDDINDLGNNIKKFKDHIPESFIPIAVDGLGNLVCLGIAGKYLNQTYFWDHNYEAEEGEKSNMKNMYRLTLNFTDFINNLQELPKVSLGDATDIIDSGDISKVKKMIASEWDVNTMLESGHTPIQRAALQNYIGIVSLLIDNGARMHGAIHQALINNHQNVIELLVSKGADINEVNEQGKIPLISAISKPNVSISKFLLSKGASVKIKDRLGRTALELAEIKSKAGYAKEMKELIPLLKAALK